MTYNKVKIGPLIMFLGFLIGMFLVMFAGVNEVFASEYNITDLQIQGYDNTGSSLTNSSTACYNGEYCEMQLTTVAGSYGGAIGIQSPVPILPNHSYAISLKIYVDTNANIALSKKNRIALGSSLGSAKYSYETNQFGNSLTYSTVNNNILQFVISSYSENAESYLLIPFTTNNTTTAIFTVTSITIDDLGENNLTQEQIETSLNNQTNDLINNQNQNTQNIIDSNKETQNVIKDQFNTCRDSYNLLQLQHSPGYTYTGNGVTFIVNDDYSVTVSGTASATTFLRLQNNIALTSGTYYFSGGVDGTGTYLQLHASNNYYANTASGTKTMIFTDNITILYVEIRIASGWTGEYTFYPMISKEKTSYEPYGEKICSNKIDETNDKLDGIQGALTDSSAPNTSGLENSAGWLPAGPLDSILNLPLTMLNSLTNSLGKTCSPLNLTLPYVNKNIQIPCLSTIFAQITGVNGLWTWVGTIASVLILYNYLLNLYAWVDRVLTLRAEFDEAMGADLANWGRL